MTSPTAKSPVGMDTLRILSTVFQEATYALVPVETPLIISSTSYSPKELDVTEDIETTGLILV